MDRILLRNKQGFPPGQFGCRHGRSTSDAVANLVSLVETAWERKQMALTLLLDVRGAFDQVNKQRLTTMRNRMLIHMPFLPIRARQRESGFRFSGMER